MQFILVVRYFCTGYEPTSDDLDFEKLEEEKKEEDAAKAKVKAKTGAAPAPAVEGQSSSSSGSSSGSSSYQMQKCLGLETCDAGWRLMMRLQMLAQLDQFLSS